MGRGVAWIRVGGVSLKTRPERLASTVLANSEDSYDIRTMHQTGTLNMWAFGLEIVVMISDRQEDPPRQDNVVGWEASERPCHRSSTNFNGCRMQWHIKKSCHE